jgi:hypothetical protein
VVVKAAIRLTFGAWLIYLSILAPSLAALDGRGMLNLGVSIAQNHSIAVDPAYGEPGRDGKFYSKWYPLLSFIAVPFVAAGLYLAEQTHLPAEYVAGVFAILLSTIIAALTVGATYYLARFRLGATERHALAAALGFGFGTLALRHSRSFYADPLLGLIVTLALILLLAEAPNAGALAILCGLAILAKPPGLLLGLAAILYLCLRRNYEATFLCGCGTALGATLYAAYNWARFGSVFASGQPNLWNLRLAPIGFAGLLVSPSVGLLLCCPVILLAFRNPKDSKTRLILGISAGYLLLYACCQGWPASSWGPRLLIPIMPALIASSVLTKRRKLWLVLALVGAFLQIPTLLGSPERYDTVLAQRGLREADTAWSFRLAPTVALWHSSLDQVHEALQHPDVRDFAVYHPTAMTLQDSRNYRIVPLWWWMLPLVHVPRVVGILISFIGILMGFWIIASRNATESFHPLLKTTMR